MKKTREKFSIKDRILSLIPEEERGARFGDELFFICPNPEHNDEHPTNCSINLNTGVFYCFACGFGGNLKDLERLKMTTNKYSGKCFTTNSEEDPFGVYKKVTTGDVW